RGLPGVVHGELQRKTRRACPVVPRSPAILQTPDSGPRSPLLWPYPSADATRPVGVPQDRPSCLGHPEIHRQNVRFGAVPCDAHPARVQRVEVVPGIFHARRSTRHVQTRGHRGGSRLQEPQEGVPSCHFESRLHRALFEHHRLCYQICRHAARERCVGVARKPNPHAF
ncbi:hypothetical protein WICPIJ_005990, partial [Wickerhamomyces pijperi]